MNMRHRKLWIGQGLPRAPYPWKGELRRTSWEPESEEPMHKNKTGARCLAAASTEIFVEVDYSCLYFTRRIPAMALF